MADAAPADAAARARIAADLSTSLLVEAGAGSGKTAAMVGRMVALVRTGAATVDRIAAVTFTRKAAGELRERFHEALEGALRQSPAAGPERARLARALADPDGAFVGTVHAFCARLLRERPVEAGLPPDFREAEEGEEERLFADGWRHFLDHLDAGGSRLPAALARVGLRPADLRGLFREVAARPEVRFAAPAAPRPDSALVAAVRAELEALLDASLPHLPAEPPAAGWDTLQSKLVALRFSRAEPGWSGEAAFHDALSVALLRPNDVVRARWGAGAEEKEAAAALGERWTSFGAEGGAARGTLAAWLAHRYPPALRTARAAAAFCARERRRAGVVTFDDLLALAASLLRRSGAARRELGERWRHLLVDEFQDTDPLQAEVVFLLAAADPDEGDWRCAVPRPGALFVVGDPKQSIYRFRRADLAVYRAVKARFHGFGAVVRLTASFRASAAVAAFVNRVFAGLLPSADGARQPAFAPLVAGAARGGRVGWYAVEAQPGRGRVTGRRVAVPDAAALASWIAERVASGERAPGDFLVVTRTRHFLAEYAGALEARGVPVHLAGGGAGAGAEVRELALLLRALADPGDAVRTVAVLEGPFFGLSHDDLHAHAAAGGVFCFAVDPPAPGPVPTALMEMREMARTAAAIPADAAVEALADRLGLLPHAVTAASGASRAGALLFALDTLRGSSPGSLAEAADRLERAVDADADAPLRPGGGDAVRVMNLHRAKGLEAAVVILACPAPAAAAPPAGCVVERGDDGVSRGFLLARGGSRRADDVLAAPARWPELAAAEAAWSEAEEVRLLYVAATRARDELVVARCGRTAGSSVWRAFHAALDDPALAAELPVRVLPPPPRPVAEDDAASIVARAASLAEQRRVMARPTWRLEPRPSLDERADGSPAGGGSHGSADRWRSAIRRVLAAAADGASDDALRGVCRDALLGGRARDEGCAEVDDLLAFIAAVRASAVWARSDAAERRLVGVPFAILIPAGEARALRIADDVGDDGGTPGEPGAECDTLVEGVLDLAFRSLGRWTIVDFGTFAARGSAADLDLARCRRRLDLHAACWERITGEPVQSRLVMGPGARVEE